VLEADSLFEGIDFFASISRGRFEELISDLLKRCGQGGMAIYWGRGRGSRGRLPTFGSCSPPQRAVSQMCFIFHKILNSRKL